MNRFQHYLAGEFVEDYEEGRLSRRDALKLIASVTGSTLLANTLLAACSPPPEPVPASPTALPGESNTPMATSTSAPASGTVAPDHPGIVAGPVRFPGDDAELLGYLARPVGDGPSPVVLVCHENSGLTAHIEDVARRLAVAGYVGLAVDLLSREGGTSALDSFSIAGLLSAAPPERFVQDFVSGWRYLQGQPFTAADQVGMIGFCFGGGVTWLVATRMPELKAAVPFYGPHPPVEDVPLIQAPVLAIYAENDSRINQDIPDIEAAMQAQGKIYQKVVYPATSHAFHNDTGSRYDADAARDAWARSLAWLELHLTAP